MSNGSGFTKKGITIGILAILAIIILTSTAYVIREDEQVVIVRLGNPIRQHMEPGLYFRIPFIEEINRYTKKILTIDEPERPFPTKDSVYISIDATARWRIIDPINFRKFIINLETANNRLNQIIVDAIGEIVGSNLLIEIIRSDTSNRIIESIIQREKAYFGALEYVSDEDEIEQEEPSIQVEEEIFSNIRTPIYIGREELIERIEERCISSIEEENFGIELVDIYLKRINYSKQEVIENVYNRMRMERSRIANLYRSEGDMEARRILGQMDRDLKTIRSQAQQRVREIRGGADAEAAQIYANAYNRDPQFYSFYKTLETYKDTIKPDTTLILTTQNEYLEYFQDLP